MGNWQEVIRPIERVGVKSHVNLQIRKPEEMELVANRALIWACGGSDRARKLLRGVDLVFFGKTWGSSLMVADDGTGLIEVGRVIDEIDRISRLEVKGWRGELVARLVGGLMLYPFDTPLYLAMAEDLGGQSILEEVAAKVATLGLTIPGETMRLAKEVYGQMAGKSYWEAEKKSIFWSFSLCYFFLRSSMIEPLKFWDSAELEEVGLELDGFLVRARERARDLARVMLGRGLITPDQGISLGWGELKYSDVLELLN